ncbi:diguanylate cyclase [Corallincola spongiicola]|uniref:diguanylate cyclase n=2 Tax=Corallincola spongiicola TaxID=2520508 RepID=A0ABY1WKX8_9GAMM|nr:diguanylate cyclase [Corallincola spongiicola]
MRIERLILAWLWLILMTFSVNASAAWVLSDDTQQTDVTVPCCELYVADDSSLSASQVMTLPPAAWQSLPTSRVNFGFSAKTFWVRLTVDNRAATTKQWILALDNPLLDVVNVYLQSPSVPLRQVAALAEGDTGRLVSHPEYLVPLNISNDPGVSILLVSFQTQGAAELSFSVWDRDSFIAADHRRSLGWGLLFGALLLMALYNVLLAVSTRVMSYLTYAAYVSCATLLMAGLIGFNSYYMWPNSPWLQHLTTPFLGGATLLFASLFLQQLTQVDSKRIVISRWLRVIQLGTVSYLLLVFVLDYRTAVLVFAGLVVVVVLSLLSISCWLSLQRVALAKYYAVGWFALLVGAFISSLAYLGWLELPVSNFTPFLLGAVTEVVVVTLTLAMRVGQSYRGRQLAEKSAMEQARRVRQVQDKSMQMQAKANADLEQKVQERTFELEVALRELADTNRELEEQNTRDALTGVRNRKYFDKRYMAEQRRSRREQTPLALIMADIDHFKQINDTYGHPVGDICIREVASRAAEVVKRPGDVVARYGGEEFALILPNTSPEGARQLAERLCSAIRDQGVVTGVGELPLTISCGVACLFIDPQLPPETLLAQADKALYQAKQQGRDRVCVFITEEQQVE